MRYRGRDDEQSVPDLDQCGTYTSIPSVQEIVVLRTDRVGAELMRGSREGDWPERPLTITEGNLVLESIGFEAALSELSMPHVAAAVSREHPSNANASARIRRAALASRLRPASCRSSSADKSRRVIATAIPASPNQHQEQQITSPQITGSHQSR